MNNYFNNKKMKSKLPRPLVNFAKKIIIPLLRNKWKKNPTVAEWVNKGYINDEEIDFIVLDWNRFNAPTPPPHKIKQQIIAEFGKKYGCKVLVETGTFRGDMMEAQKNNFEKLFSVELSVDFWETAKKRFKNDSQINLIQGDSGEVLPKLVPTIDQPALFWLDGHYCGGKTALSKIECPIYAEIDAVFKDNKGHIMMIDDARLFIGKHDYPTINELTNYIKEIDKNYSVTVEQDIIRVVKA